MESLTPERAILTLSVCTGAVQFEAVEATATTSDPAIGAFTPEYFVVAPGMKASAIRVTTNATLHVSELSG